MFSVYLLVYVPLDYSICSSVNVLWTWDDTLKPPFSSEYGFLGMHF